MTDAPYAAGSIMFWPPRPGRRLPPTNATSANPQTAANSPMVSIKMIEREPPAPFGIGRRHPAPAHDHLALLLQPLRHAIKSLGMTRHQDQPQARMLLARGPICRQHRGFLPFHRAARHEDQVR